MTAYEKVVSASRSYLGPATESFIARQCRSHLKKEPADLMHSDLTALSNWMEVSATLVMDQDKAVELAKKIASL